MRAVYALIGSTIGSMIPLLWGAGEFSFSSILLGGVGAVLGIWLVYQQNNSHY